MNAERVGMNDNGHIHLHSPAFARFVALAGLRLRGFVCIVSSRHPRGRREVLPQAACLNPEHMEALL
ncbi:hypothetical protein FQZ97_881440 [compost metagenome]